MKWLVLVILAGCCPPAKPTQTPGSGGPGSGSAATPPPVATTCDGLRPKLEGLYRAEAQQKEPKRVEEAVSDNTTMVLNDCARDPAKVVACVNAAATIGELESKCLRPLDDEGTEGTELLRK